MSSILQNANKRLFSVMVCRLTLTEIFDNSVLNKDNAINNGRIKVNSFDWYVPPYTTSVSQQAVLPKQILSKVPTQLQ